MSTVETRFLVPIREDANVGSGDLHSYNKWEKLERELFAMFSGWTLNPGLHKGAYPDPDTGEPIRDLSKEYRVALSEEKIPELRRYIKEVVAVDFRQKVIYFFNGREVEFVENAER